MKNLKPEEKNIMKNIIIPFRLEIETIAIKDRILSDTKNIFEHEK